MTAQFPLYAAFARRSVLRIVRSPEIVISTAIFPLLLMLTLSAVFSGAVEAFEGEEYAQRLVPGLVVGGIIFGSLGAAISMSTDLTDGYMSRVRSMPVPAVAPLIGTVLAEGLRALLALAVLVSVGFAFGFRFEAGAIRAVAFVLVAMVAAMSMTMIGLASAIKVRDPEAVASVLNMVFLVMLFLSPSMVPIDAYPDWAEPIVRVNPATAYVELLDHLARGGDLARQFLVAGAWSAALLGVFGAIAARGIRSA